MKYHKQTKFGFKEGNCFSTCIACILDTDPELVPNVCVEKDWQFLINKWLQIFGLVYWDFGWPNAQQIVRPMTCILTGHSPKKKIQKSFIVL